MGVAVFDANNRPVAFISIAAIESRLGVARAALQGNIYGGMFVPGHNPICMTFEVTLEEWLPSALS